MPRLTGKEKITNLDTEVLEFWAWAYSDMLNNANRGVFAEFLVGKALGVNMQECRELWDSFDLIYKNYRIEIKSSAYLQSWVQTKTSTDKDIIFRIRPKKDWNKENNTYSATQQRNAEIYVFCLYQEKESKQIEKLFDTNNWAFWVVETKMLNEKMPEQQTISFNVLKKMATKCGILDLKEKIEAIIGK